MTMTAVVFSQNLSQHNDITSCTCEWRTFRSFALSIPRAKSPQREFSFPWNFRSVEHSLLRTFAPVELSFLDSEHSKNFRSLELLFLCNFCFLRQNILYNLITFTPIVKTWPKAGYTSHSNLRALIYDTMVEVVLRCISACLFVNACLLLFFIVCFLACCSFWANKDIYINQIFSNWSAGNAVLVQRR